MPKVIKESASEGATTENVGGGARRRQMADALSGSMHTSAAKDVCLWFLAKNKSAAAKRGFRDRRQQTLSIDARCRSRVEHEAAA